MKLSRILLLLLAIFLILPACEDRTVYSGYEALDILSVEQDNNDVVIRFEREKEIQRYTVFSGNDSITDEPYTEIKFADGNSIGVYDFYPEEW
jgi:hypothetical protein